MGRIIYRCRSLIVFYDFIDVIADNSRIFQTFYFLLFSCRPSPSWPGPSVGLVCVSPYLVKGGLLKKVNGGFVAFVLNMRPATSLLCIVPVQFRSRSLGRGPFSCLSIWRARGLNRLDELAGPFGSGNQVKRRVEKCRACPVGRVGLWLNVSENSII